MTARAPSTICEEDAQAAAGPSACECTNTCAPETAAPAENKPAADANAKESALETSAPAVETTAPAQTTNDDEVMQITAASPAEDTTDKPAALTSEITATPASQPTKTDEAPAHDVNEAAPEPVKDTPAETAPNETAVAGKTRSASKKRASPDDNTHTAKNPKNLTETNVATDVAALA